MLPGSEREGSILKVLVVRCLRSKCLFAHAVPQKGMDEARYVVDCIVSDIIWMGHTRVILKADNEPAIGKVLKEVLKSLRIEGLEQAAEERPPPYDSQANGAIEIGCKLVKGMSTTLRKCLENRIGWKIPPEHPLMTWLVAHSAHLLTIRVRDEDGKTAYHRVRGRPFSTRLVSMGERLKFKLRPKEHMRGDAVDKWHSGIFLGFCKRTGQYILHDKQTVRFARTVMRNPDEMKWDKAAMEAVHATPWHIHVPKAQDVIFKDQLEQDKQEEPPGEDRKVKRFTIKERDCERFGYTAGCTKCDDALRYGWAYS